MALSERYARQMIFKGIGEEGQHRLSQAKVAIIGMGALGTVLANNLVRAGVGHIRLVDRDYVELSNLQRQTIYSEADAQERLPKAVAATQYLKKVNSEIVLEPIIKDVNPLNVENIIAGCHLVLDGTDNLETRFLLNDASLKNNIPWIYGGALGSHGMTMNIIPGETACLRCFLRGLGQRTQETCATTGVLNMLTGIIACYESAEALKILIGSPQVRKNILYLDIWNNEFMEIDIEPQEECPSARGIISF